MPHSKQEALNALYEQRFTSPSRLEEVCGTAENIKEFAESLDGPFVVAVAEEYLAAKPRIVVVGQETYGWVGPYSEFLSKGNLAASIAEYVQFDFGLRQGGSIFWRKVAEIRNELLGLESSPQSMIAWHIGNFEMRTDHRIPSRS